MPPTGYLSVAGVEKALEFLAKKYPGLCERIVLPERTHEGRTCSALRIGKAAGAGNGVLMIGGVHAREIVNSELLVRLAFRLCASYTAGTGLAFGGKSFTAGDIKLLVETLDLFVFPQVNPDGRAFVFSPTGDAWWRKNRRPSAGGCIGVDLNRNFDFLWSSSIGSSTDPCSLLYRGSSAFSEAETRNVKHLVDSYAAAVMVDVHSYSKLILYPWGDDDNQTATPAMNFANPAYDGVRGIIGDSAYREFIPAGDLNWFVDTAARVQAAIAAVRGTSYTPEAGAGLYPTSGCSNDYAYARHFSASSPKIRGFCIETGTEFQPPHDEAVHVMDEVSAGLVELCLASVCIVESVAAASPLRTRLDDLRRFREKVLLPSKAGREYAALLEAHNRELFGLVLVSRELGAKVRAALEAVAKVVLTFEDPKPAPFDAGTTKLVRGALELAARGASPALRASLARVRRDLGRFEGKTVAEALRAVARLAPAAGAGIRRRGAKKRATARTAPRPSR